MDAIYELYTFVLEHPGYTVAIIILILLAVFFSIMLYEVKNAHQLPDDFEDF